MLSLPAPFATALAQNYVPNAIFVQADFLTGSVYFWSGWGPLTWNGQTWLGVNDPLGRTFGQITPLRTESSEFRFDNVTLSLSGIPAGIVTKALAECRVNKQVKVWYGIVTRAGVVADPQVCFNGRMDVPTVSDDGTTCSISLTVENRAFDATRARERRYTHEDQQIDFPGDLGFQFVQDAQKSSVWGRAVVPSSVGGPGSGGPFIGPRGPGALLGNG